MEEGIFMPFEFKSCNGCNAVLAREVDVCPECNGSSFINIDPEKIEPKQIKPWIRKWPNIGEWRPVTRKDILEK
jgi:hypothetical protein